MGFSTEARKPWTSDELCRFPEGSRYEIGNGQLVTWAPTGGEHGRTENASRAVASFGPRAHRLLRPRRRTAASRSSAKAVDARLAARVVPTISVGFREPAAAR